MKNPTSNKKGRHRNMPGKSARIEKGKAWDLLKAQTMGRSTIFSADRLSATISKFKEANGRPHKPNGKKPINRPK
ncbi:MAG: hypothetical protein WCG20_01430 [bacterium]